ncbi:hypothetical protein H2200_007436 [Cladophialophora chaetospira]|uniref:Uncharacterized protein n=1 Tax=Cladophialophora chaetospira TaxID=386627 RepID=A0AA38X7Y7_9EURO|nr:hypothetical protein H2200_007436 [Cladophialophora chaetospira]
MRTRPRPYKMEKSERFFRSCNNWQTVQRRSGRVREVLSLCDITNDQVNDIMDAAVTIWKRLKMPRIKSINLNVRRTKEGLRKTKDELRIKYPEVFEQQCAGVQQQMFLRETAPEAVFYCVNAGTDVQEMRPVIITRPSNSQSAPLEEDNDTSYEPSEKSDDDEDMAEDDLIDEDQIGEDQPTTVSRGQRSLVVTLKVDTVGLRRILQNTPAKSPQSLPKQKQPQAEQGSSKETVMVDLTQVKDEEIKEEDKISVSKETLSKIPRYEHEAKASREDKALKGIKSTPPPTTQPSQPLFLEIVLAKTKSLLLQLELKHLVEEARSSSTPSYRKLEDQVKQWPYSTWPEQMVFIHVTPETSLNVPIFSQGMLDTAFEDWLRNGHDRPTRSRCFRLYANDQDGPPPVITDA